MLIGISQEQEDKFHIFYILGMWSIYYIVYTVDHESRAKLSQGRKRSEEWEEGGAENEDWESRGRGKNSE